MADTAKPLIQHALEMAPLSDIELACAIRIPVHEVPAARANPSSLGFVERFRLAFTLYAQADQVKHPDAAQSVARGLLEQTTTAFQQQMAAVVQQAIDEGAEPEEVASRMKLFFLRELGPEVLEHWPVLPPLPGDAP